jgi:hypothetical protein
MVCFKYIIRIIHERYNNNFPQLFVFIANTTILKNEKARIPQEFVQLIKYFYSDAKTIEEYWHMTEIAAFRNNSETERELVLK